MLSFLNFEQFDLNIIYHSLSHFNVILIKFKALTAFKSGDLVITFLISFSRFWAILFQLYENVDTAQPSCECYFHFI